MTPEETTARGPHAGPLLYAGAIFASAFLLFLVQPMVGKRLLPWFGGAPGVWILCLAFYQTTLFAGYAYAHLLNRYVSTPARQTAVHGAVFAAAVLALPVLPREVWPPGAGLGPGASVMATLARYVALPFLFLAATAPLVQVWFARRYPERSPYPLYAVSNFSSLAALVGYPLVFEPRAPLSTTGLVWSLAFVATGLAVLACAALGRGGAAAGAQASAASAPGEAGGDETIAPGRVLLWLLLPACAVVLLMGVSNELCLDIASVPFLWMLPLGVYLVSFIVCFGSDRTYRRGPYIALTAAPFVLQLGLSLPIFSGTEGIFTLADSVQLRVVLNCLLLFGACMVLHGELARLRPSPRHLTAYYLCISGGGAAGGLFVGALAPLLFRDYYEFQVGIFLGWLLLLAACWRDTGGWLSRQAPWWRWVVVVSLSALVLAAWARPSFAPLAGLLHQERTFFGVLRVVETPPGPARQRLLYNGTTLHGVQFPAAERRPTIVFGVQTGIGSLMAQRPAGEPMKVGVVGLGIGTLATYGRPGDLFRFYELDPAVVRLARDAGYFSFLADSPAEIEVVEGDARLALAAELARGEAPGFDLLVVDAFTGVAIPIHLLTREAIALYREALAPDGLLAIHISNRHLDLVPLLARLAGDASLELLVVETQPVGRFLSAQATWGFLGRDAGRLRSLAGFARSRAAKLGLPADAVKVFRPPPDEGPLWTDDYSDLWSALRPFPLRIVVGGDD